MRVLIRGSIKPQQWIGHWNAQRRNAVDHGFRRHVPSTGCKHQTGSQEILAKNGCVNSTILQFTYMTICGIVFALLLVCCHAPPAMESKTSPHRLGQCFGRRLGVLVGCIKPILGGGLLESFVRKDDGSCFQSCSDDDGLVL